MQGRYYTNSLLFLNKHRRFIGCENDLDCVEKFIAEPVEINASQLLIKKSNLKDGEDVMESAQVYLSGVKTRSEQQSPSSCGAARGMPSV